MLMGSMEKTTTPPDSIDERIRKRNSQAEHYAVDRPKWEQRWSRFHLGVANMIDGFSSFFNSKVISAMGGAVVGFAEGFVYAGLFFTAVSLLNFATPVGILLGALAGGAIYSAVQAVRYYNDAEERMPAVQAAEAADGFARQHNVLARGKSKVVAEALGDLDKELDLEEPTADDWKNLEDKQTERQDRSFKDLRYADDEEISLSR